MRALELVPQMLITWLHDDTSHGENRTNLAGNGRLYRVECNAPLGRPQARGKMW
jgi:hypothetical protein